MDFFITLILAGVAGWLANFLYTNLYLGPVVYFVTGILGGALVNFIFQVFNIPFLTGYMGDFGFALIGSLLIYGIITIFTRSKSSENY